MIECRGKNGSWIHLGWVVLCWSTLLVDPGVDAYVSQKLESQVHSLEQGFLTFISTPHRLKNMRRFLVIQIGSHCCLTSLHRFKMYGCSFRCKLNILHYLWFQTNTSSVSLRLWLANHSTVVWPLKSNAGSNLNWKNDTRAKNIYRRKVKKVVYR